MLESGVLTVAIFAMLASLVADIAYSLLNPRIRHASAE
jgi:ABC-type dipeptide/oligopeptide/nickel transport system permease component